MYKALLNAYQKQVEEFKRDLLTRALIAHGGNRTHAAKTLGLQRTYLLRLIRQLALSVPSPPRARRNGKG